MWISAIKNFLKKTKYKLTIKQNKYVKWEFKKDNEENNIIIYFFIKT